MIPFLVTLVHFPAFRVLFPRCPVSLFCHGPLSMGKFLSLTLPRPSLGAAAPHHRQTRQASRNVTNTSEPDLLRSQLCSDSMNNNYDLKLAFMCSIVLSFIYLFVELFFVYTSIAFHIFLFVFFIFNKAYLIFQ